MVNLIQPITIQQAYDGITHARRWASWNWWWRMADDDDGEGFPSPEPRTDSRSALPRGCRAWRRLRIVKRVESFSLVFSPQKWIYGVKVEVGGALGGPRGKGRAQGGRRAPHPRGQVVGPLALILSTVIFYIFQKYSLWSFRSFRELLFLHKNNTMAILLKTASVRVVPFKSCKLECKTRAKVFGKVETLETYQLPQA